MDSLCIECNSVITPRQHSLNCDSCFRPQQRTCDSGVDIVEYREAMKMKLQIHFVCTQCTARIPMHELSTSESIESEGAMGDFTIGSLGLPSANSTIRTDQMGDFTIGNITMDTEPSDTTYSVYIDATTMEIIDTDDQPSTTNIGMDMSFNIDVTLNVNSLPQPIIESDIEEPMLSETILPDGPVSYEVVENGTKRGSNKLVSSDGYSYTVKKSSQRTTLWRCSIRNKNLSCKATVSQRSDIYMVGAIPHSHPGDPGITKRTKVHAKVMMATLEPLQQLMTYLEVSWMRNSVWGVHQWFVFRQFVRTNNDVEDN